MNGFDTTEETIDISKYKMSQARETVTKYMSR